MTQEELNKILENHKHWLNHDCDGWETMRANLEGADLRHANLSNAYLEYAILTKANLDGADLSNANLCFADLCFADLCFANLTNADLRLANLSNANLEYTQLNMANLSLAILRCADLSFAKLIGTNLSFAHLSFTDLSCANLSNADLGCTDLSTANLRLADLSTAFNMPHIPLACPSDGAFIGWKIVDRYLIKLQIPASAKRCSATTNKCRCDKAKVLGIYNLDGTKANITSIKNCDYAECEYIVGKMVYPDSFDEDRWNECSHGIHFFINKLDAIGYC